MGLLNFRSRFFQVLLVAALGISAAVLYASSSLATGDATTEVAEPDELAQWGLPLAMGREEVEIYCSACHSLRLVAQQGLSRSDWDELFDWMVEEQEMEEMPAEDKKLVLDYLSTYRGTGRKLEQK